MILAVENVYLDFGTRPGLLRRKSLPVLRGITLTLQPGETLGMIGRNGCGKSTLLRLMAGILHPASGRVLVSAETTRAVLALGLGFRNDLSGRDNAMLSSVLQGCSRDRAERSLEQIREFSELGAAFERPVGTYSSGMRARLGFATALISHVDILFIDEVLGVGDGAFRQKAAEALKGRIRGDQTVVLVSHNLKEVCELCDRVVWLEEGKIAETGNPELVVENYSKSLRTRQRRSDIDAERV